MEIEAVKVQVVHECTLLGGGLPYDPDSIRVIGDPSTLAADWDSLADTLADYARHIQSCCARISGYAGYARRRANEG